jgi:hypothetical protein
MMALPMAAGLRRVNFQFIGAQKSGQFCSVRRTTDTQAQVSRTAAVCDLRFAFLARRGLVPADVSQDVAGGEKAAMDKLSSAGNDLMHAGSD